MARGLPYLLFAARSPLYDESRGLHNQWSGIREPSARCISPCPPRKWRSRDASYSTECLDTTDSWEVLILKTKEKMEPWRGSDRRAGHRIDKVIRSFSAKRLAVRLRERREFPSSYPSRTHRYSCPAELCSKIIGRSSSAHQLFCEWL